jgi:hypothetical protein
MRGGIMKLIKKAILTITSMFITLTPQAASFNGQLLKVVSPREVVVLSSDNAFIHIHLLGPMFDGDETKLCDDENVDDHIKDKCEALSDILENKPLGVTIERYDKDTMYGDIVFGDQLLSQYMIEEGWYRVDYKNVSAKYLFESEKKAFCNYKGIWRKNKGKHEVVNLCMRR